MLTAVATFGACRCVSEDCVRRATANEAQHTAVETPWRIWEETVLRKQAAALDAAAVVRSEVGGLSPLPRHSMVVIEKVVDTAVLRGSKRVGVYDKEPVPTPTPLQTQTLSPRTPTSLPHSLTANWRCSSASCHTQMLASRASQARAQPQKACNELALIVSCHTLVDPDARRVLLSSPKAGATIAAQLFFRSLGLTEKALAYSPWVHHYKMQFNLRPGGRVDPCVVCRPGSGWTCVKIVRSPLARVISSYVHIIRHSAQFGLADSTFDTFVRILEDQATAAQRSLFDDHFMPQASPCDLEAPPLLLPLETIDEGILPAFAEHTGFWMDPRGLESAHYVSRTSTDEATDVQSYSRWVPATDIEAATSTASSADSQRVGRSMSEAAQRLLNTSSKLRRSVCCLYRKDVALYRRACAQDWLLEGCPRCAERCAKEVAELELQCEL